MSIKDANMLRQTLYFAMNEGTKRKLWTIYFLWGNHFLPLADDNLAYAMVDMPIQKHYW